MQFIFGFSVFFFQIFALYFCKVVEIVRALGVYTFVLAEEFPVFWELKYVRSEGTKIA